MRLLQAHKLYTTKIEHQEEKSFLTISNIGKMSMNIEPRLDEIILH